MFLKMSSSKRKIIEELFGLNFWARELQLERAS
jgi:hypothetical protein